MQFSRKALNARWAWSGGLAILLLVLLNLLDSVLKTRTGYGVADLQGVSTGWGIRVIADHWTSPPDAVLAGFGLGLDFLFIPLYGAALFFGALAAIDRYAPKPGSRRRIMTLLALAPVGAAICDAAENLLEISMLQRSPTDLMASITLETTAAKFVGIAIGLVLTLMALAGKFWKRKA
jgi:hypothetical protein